MTDVASPVTTTNRYRSADTLAEVIDQSGQPDAAIRGATRSRLTRACACELGSLMDRVLSSARSCSPARQCLNQVGRRLGLQTESHQPAVDVRLCSLVVPMTTKRWRA
jgi:hypothetical protein